mgnify:CR=1 FL=1
MAENGKKTTQDRGSERKAELIKGVIRLLAKSGTLGVTHRAVADEAGAAHGSTRYYFSTRDDMLLAALQELVSHQISEIEKLFSKYEKKENHELWPALAKFLSKRMESERDNELARYELFLAAARNEKFQSLLEEWATAYASLFEARLEESEKDMSLGLAVQLLNLINGLILSQLAAPVDGFEKNVLLPSILRFMDA